MGGFSAGDSSRKETKMSHQGGAPQRKGKGKKGGGHKGGTERKGKKISKADPANRKDLEGKLEENSNCTEKEMEDDGSCRWIDLG